MMYSTMVHYTGAVPAEHFSRLKRPEYAAYQVRVNRFFPGPRHEDRHIEDRPIAEGPAAASRDHSAQRHDQTV